jgi:NADPH:quinone reductase-like Zn-dependent oxidoreductase
MVLDPVGGRSFRQSFQMLAPMGRLCMFGAFSTAPSLRRSPLALAKGLLAMPWFHPIPLINQNKVVIGVNLGHLWMQMDKLRSDFQEILNLCVTGTFDPVVDRTFPFEEAPASHRYIQERRNLGKVLLSP